MNIIHIAFASDENYLPHLGCLIASILMNSKSDEEFHFYVLDGGISEEGKTKLASLHNLHNFEIEYLKPDWEQLRACPDVNYLSRNTYLRLLLPELLPNLDKILYLDCDMIVTSDLSELYNADLHDTSIGIVLDYYEIVNKLLAKNFKKGILLRLAQFVKFHQIIRNIGLMFHKKRFVNLWDFVKMMSSNRFWGISAKTFNAGLLLIDLKKLKENHKFDDTIQWITQHIDSLLCADQDALNVIFAQDRTELPLKWNIQIYPDWKNDPWIKKLDLTEEFGDLLTAPKGIIHYLSYFKPSHPFYAEKIGKYYRQYLALTPWKDWKPEITQKDRKFLFKQENKFYCWLKFFVLNHLLKDFSIK